MNHSTNAALHQFKDLVGIKFQLYNSLFTSLPFHRIERTGILLSMLLNDCEEGYRKGLSPTEILDGFFQRSTNCKSQKERTDMLFRMVQYIERQVVLFDALEDAAFKQVHDMHGTGTLKHLEQEVYNRHKLPDLEKKLKDFSIRLVLTAHPTQFYPGSVLGIINDLAKALGENNTNLINTYLQQLGKTPFFKKQKPTPYDEAVSLIWYLENVFYFAAGRIITYLKRHFSDIEIERPMIEMGFWPGGDRDGNPNVNSDTTLKVADALRQSIIKCYYLDVRRMKRRLTFQGVDVILSDLENVLYSNLFIPGHRTSISRNDILAPLQKIRDIITNDHNGLFLHLVDNLINKIQVFGLHFASLDVRQDSSVHGKVLDCVAARTTGLPASYASAPAEEKITLLANASPLADTLISEDPVLQDTVDSITSIRTIQDMNGTEGCHRYIISHCTSALNVMEVYGLFQLAGWKKHQMTVDIVPLFETIDDLSNAPAIMKALYDNETYRQHLAQRGNKQTIMVGFSDGTKDGGYLMANWSIYTAKEELTRISRSYDIDVVFFDGRGGPPARGGGKTHRFYASMGNDISSKEIQLTIQGQTVSSNFGTVDAAQFNLEQLLHAGISNQLFSGKQTTLSQEEKKLLEELSMRGYDAYRSLKEHPEFLSYLASVSPLNYYGETNIGSRPSKRGQSSKLTLDDLRAIPFVGAWSQIKQNVTGYYGVGTAIRSFEEKGKLGVIKKLYHESLFFRTLIDNCEMAMHKCYFPLTAHLANDPVYGSIWKMIHEEYELTRHYVAQLTGHHELMAGYPVEQLSIQMRERIVLPLTTIQQYALSALNTDHQENDTDVFRKLVIRSSFGIINAGRNSA